jgi:hypothetical protein
VGAESPDSPADCITAANSFPLLSRCAIFISDSIFGENSLPIAAPSPETVSAFMLLLQKQRNRLAGTPQAAQ